MEHALRLKLDLNKRRGRDDELVALKAVLRCLHCVQDRLPTSLEEDEELLESLRNKDHDSSATTTSTRSCRRYSALVYRLTRKSILESHVQLVEEVVALASSAWRAAKLTRESVAMNLILSRLIPDDQARLVRYFNDVGFSREHQHTDSVELTTSTPSKKEVHVQWMDRPKLSAISSEDNNDSDWDEDEEVGDNEKVPVKQKPKRSFLPPPLVVSPRNMMASKGHQIPGEALYGG